MRECYVSTDIEADGPIPGPYSMLSLASAVYDDDATLLGTFSVNLTPLPEATRHPATMAWWAHQQPAWEACHVDPQAPEVALPRYLAWLRALPARPVFVGYPAAFDFMWVQWYLFRFTGESPFAQAALDIKSYAMAVLNRPYCDISKHSMPAHWLDARPHTHVALDDALEQGALFCNLLAENKGQVPR